MLKNFKNYVIENLSAEDRAELGAMGFSTVDVDAIVKELDKRGSYGWDVSNEGSLLTLNFSTQNDVEEFIQTDRDISSLDIERDVYLELEISINFETLEVSAGGNISQKDLNLYDEIPVDLKIDYIFQNGDPRSMDTDSIVEELESFLDSAIGYEDSTGFCADAQDKITAEVEDRLGYEDEDDNDGCGCCDDCTGEPDCECGCEDCSASEVFEKKKLKFHHSDAPDAKGKFKELGVQKLADWLIRTRGGSMQKITGSLNQQINFNKRKNPSYAKKMESTREAVKRKLAKRKNK